MIVDPRNYTKTIEPLYKAVYNRFIKSTIECAYKSAKRYELPLTREVNKFRWDKTFVRRYDLLGKKSECRHFYSDGDVAATSKHDNQIIGCSIDNLISSCFDILLVSPITNVLANITIVWIDIHLTDWHKNSITTKLLSEINEELKTNNVQDLRLFYEFDYDFLDEDFVYNKYISYLPAIEVKNI